ncbi:hypothetical protein EMIT0158MI4_20255 [Burkholderia ambifaria]
MVDFGSNFFVHCNLRINNRPRQKGQSNAVSSCHH